MLKAFVLCENITDNPASRDQKDLQGAGLSRMECVDPLPVKLSFWVFGQLSDQNETGGSAAGAHARRYGPTLLLPSRHRPTQRYGAGDRFLHTHVGLRLS
jgi:hypothetical protein